MNFLLIFSYYSYQIVSQKNAIDTHLKKIIKKFDFHKFLLRKWIFNGTEFFPIFIIRTANKRLATWIARV